MNLGFIVVSNEYILDLEIAMNHRWSLGVKIVHSTYHTLSYLQLHRPLNLYGKENNTVFARTPCITRVQMRSTCVGLEMPGLCLEASGLSHHCQ